MLKIKFIFLITFIISLILFYSCTDNPVNGNKALHIERQTGKELCTTCWLVVTVKYENGTPVPDADVKVLHMPELQEFFRGTTNDDGVVSFYTKDMRSFEGYNWDATATTEAQVGQTPFVWNGESWIEVDIIFH
jgi:hypothetical protein